MPSILIFSLVTQVRTSKQRACKARAEGMLAKFKYPRPIESSTSIRRVGRYEPKSRPNVTDFERGVFTPSRSSCSGTCEAEPELRPCVTDFGGSFPRSSHMGTYEAGSYGVGGTCPAGSTLLGSPIPLSPREAIRSAMHSYGVLPSYDIESRV
jgi:hypothetical protein